MKYVSVSIRGGAVNAQAEAAECKTSLTPTCLSDSLSVVSGVQPDTQGRRSSTFTLPPCEASRSVLMNEVAISYCSVKRVLKCMCVHVLGRKRKVNAGIGLLQREDELGKGRQADSLSGTVKSAGAVYVKILSKVPLTETRNEGEEGRGTKVGACRRLLFCILCQYL